MPIIAIFSSSHCGAEEAIARVAQTTGFPVLSDQDLVERAAKMFSRNEQKLMRAMQGPRPFFEGLTREREHQVAFLKAALAESVQQDDLIYSGFASLLLPKTLSHALRACLVAKPEFRAEQAARKTGLSEKEARALVEKEDEAAKQWTLYLFGLGPWDSRLYDIRIPLDDTSPDQAAAELVGNSRKPLLASTDDTRAAARDFLLSARVGVALVQAGHLVEVECREGSITLVINKTVLRLEKYKKEIAQVASSVEGVKEVTTRVGPHYHQPSIYPKLDLPQKILLVDDEKEFVHTLSERLQTRNLESAVAYDGEQALEIIQHDTPEVMVLDLKMPGIDGLEVLRRVKQEHPETEVIILTGHGSQAEQTLALELGAFAYLQKPVDIDVLARTMKEAYQRTAARGGAQNKEEKDG